MFFQPFQTMFIAGCQDLTDLFDVLDVDRTGDMGRWFFERGEVRTIVEGDSKRYMNIYCMCDTLGIYIYNIYEYISI